MCGIETGWITTDYNNINDIVDFIMGGMDIIYESYIV
jgi:hypothetical protein